MLFMLALIPQHYYKSNFLSNWVDKLLKKSSDPTVATLSYPYFVFSLSNYSYTNRRASVHHPRFLPYESSQGYGAYLRR